MAKLGRHGKTHQNQRAPQRETVGRVGDGGESWGRSTNVHVGAVCSTLPRSSDRHELPELFGCVHEPSDAMRRQRPSFRTILALASVHRNIRLRGCVQKHINLSIRTSCGTMQRNFRDERSNTKSRRSRGDIDAIQVGVFEGMMRYFKVYGGCPV